jgi:hypothetical protein
MLRCRTSTFASNSITRALECLDLRLLRHHRLGVCFLRE